MSDLRPMWKEREVIELCRAVETKLAPVGWHVALTGGVLRNGESDHDLDIVVFPHSTQYVNRRVLFIMGDK